MSEFEKEITSISTAITSVCMVIAAIIIAIPRMLTSCKKKSALDLKIKHLLNVIDAESRPPSTASHVIIDMKDLEKGKKRYSLANIEMCESLSPSDVKPECKSD